MQCWGPWWWRWWLCSLATAIGKKARSTNTWQWPTAAGDWTALSMSCQVSWPGWAAGAQVWLGHRLRADGGGASVCLLGLGRREVERQREEGRSERLAMDLRVRSTVLGLGLSPTRQVIRHLCLFLQMSLRATVTTTPTPATTPCHSAHLSPRPLARSVLGQGMHSGGLGEGLGL